MTLYTQAMPMNPNRSVSQTKPITEATTNTALLATQNL